MKSREWILILLAGISAGVSAQEVIVSEIYLAPAIAWHGSNDQLFAVQRASATTGVWENVDFVVAKSNGVQRWADPCSIADTQLFYRIQNHPDTNTPFTDGFEVAEGWSDYLTPAWTARVVSGTWIGYQVYTVDSASFARNSQRCLGMSYSSPVHVELPRVDYPTQIVFWAAALTGQLNLQVQTHNGLYWINVAQFSVSSTNFEEKKALFGLSASNQRIRLAIGGGVSVSTIFIDDVRVDAK